MLKQINEKWSLLPILLTICPTEWLFDMCACNRVAQWSVLLRIISLLW